MGARLEHLYPANQRRNTMLVFVILLVQKEPKVLGLFAGEVAHLARTRVVLCASHQIEAVQVTLQEL
jgi:hypothetical protein